MILIRSQILIPDTEDDLTWHAFLGHRICPECGQHKSDRVGHIDECPFPCSRRMYDAVRTT